MTSTSLAGGSTPNLEKQPATSSGRISMGDTNKGQQWCRVTAVGSCIQRSFS